MYLNPLLLVVWIVIQAFWYKFVNYIDHPLWVWRKIEYSVYLLHIYFLWIHIYIRENLNVIKNKDWSWNEGYTVIILNIGTDRSEQTVQTQIRLLLMEQSDQGLLCLLFCLHVLNTILHCKIQLFQM